MSLDVSNAPRPTRSKSSHAAPRILVVDDEDAIVFALTEFLTSMGYDVVSASRLEDGLELLRGASWDLLITDLKLTRMGGLEGLELVKAARSAEPRIAAIVLSAFTSQLDTERARLLGASAILTKPFDLSLLADEIGLLVPIR